MASIVIKRGLQTNVEDLVLKEGELAVALDTGNVYVGTTAGTHHVNPKISTANVAKKLEAARAFSITGDGVAPATNFDGTGNVALAFALAAQPGLAAGTYTKLTVNTKGIVTGASNLTVSDLPGLGSAATKNTGKAAGNVVMVESDGKIDGSLIPSLAITDVFEASNEAAMLALSNARPGDICVRTDENKSYILKTAPFSTLENWVWLRTPSGNVISVNGKTGAVALTKADVGLSNVDNTADSAKSVAKAAQMATARSFSITGGATASGVNYDGSGNVALNVTSLDASKLTGEVDGGTF